MVTGTMIAQQMGNVANILGYSCCVFQAHLENDSGVTIEV